jgi:hypothetical protein
MNEYSNKEGVLHTILVVLNLGLEVILGLIALGCLIGIWEVLK